MNNEQKDHSLPSASLEQNGLLCARLFLVKNILEKVQKKLLIYFVVTNKLLSLCNKTQTK